MKIELHIPDSIKLDPGILADFTMFLQATVNRRCVGALRYGDRPHNGSRYMRRLQLESLPPIAAREILSSY